MHRLRCRLRIRGRNLGLRDAIAAYESSPSRGGDVTPEVSLALLIALARRHPERTPFGPYAAALPADPPPSPIFFPDEKLEALLPYLPLSLVDDIDAARQEMYTLWDVATAVMERVKVDGEPAAALGVDEFAWAWMMIRSRAVTFRVRRAEGGGDGGRAAVHGARGGHHEPRVLAGEGPVAQRPVSQGPAVEPRLATEPSRGEPPGRYTRGRRFRGRTGTCPTRRSGCGTGSSRNHRRTGGAWSPFSCRSHR